MNAKQVRSFKFQDCQQRKFSKHIRHPMDPSSTRNINTNTHDRQPSVPDTTTTHIKPSENPNVVVSEESTKNKFVWKWGLLVPTNPTDARSFNFLIISLYC